MLTEIQTKLKSAFMEEINAQLFDLNWSPD